MSVVYQKVKHVIERVIDNCVEVKCDICGRKSDHPNWGPDEAWKKNTYDKLSVQVSITSGAVYPEGGSYSTTAWTICPTCFEEKLTPFLESFGGKPREEEHDV